MQMCVAAGGADSRDDHRGGGRADIDAAGVALASAEVSPAAERKIGRLSLDLCLRQGHYLLVLPRCARGGDADRRVDQQRGFEKAVEGAAGGATEGLMASFDATVQIRRTQSELFWFLMDPHNNLRWQTGLIATGSYSDGPVGLGSRFWEIRSVLGRRLETAVEVVRFEEPAMAAIHCTAGPVPFVATYRVRGSPWGALLPDGLRHGA